jgi:hypothetical protein
MFNEGACFAGDCFSSAKQFFRRKNSQRGCKRLAVDEAVSKSIKEKQLTKGAVATVFTCKSCFFVEKTNEGKNRRREKQLTKGAA